MLTLSKNTVSGYAGKILRVDMTNAKLSTIQFDEKTLRKYIGGTGIGATDIEWSHPENRLIIAAGPLSGTSIGGSGTISVITKGALTNGATATQANGYFGAFLKFSGYDGIVIQGSSKRWMYLHIDDDTVTLRDASHLLNTDTYDTADRIKNELGKQDLQMSVLSIGPAGENMVRFASVFVDKGHAAGHNGAGAVMGSKKLKAIAIARGTKRGQPMDRTTLRQVAEQLYEQVKGWSGTVGGVGRPTRTPGTLPIKNYTTNLWDIPKDKFNGFTEDYIRKTFDPTPHPCWACRLNHATMMKITSGPYTGTVVEEPEYEQLAAWGPVIDNQDISSALMLSGLTDRLGLEQRVGVASWMGHGMLRAGITREE
jgi:aldehyde:ferredoxin oxidoreductase